MGNTKLCTGPAHTRPTPLPCTDEYWHFHKSGPNAGKPVARCRICTNWHKMRDPQSMGNNHGYTLWAPIKPLYEELLLRCDGNQAEVARLSGVHRRTINQAHHGHRNRIQ